MTANCHLGDHALVGCLPAQSMQQRPRGGNWRRLSQLRTAGIVLLLGLGWFRLSALTVVPGRDVPSGPF
jgi:hypothetical protein